MGSDRVYHKTRNQTQKELHEKKFPTSFSSIAPLLTSLLPWDFYFHCMSISHPLDDAGIEGFFTALSLTSTRSSLMFPVESTYHFDLISASCPPFEASFFQFHSHLGFKLFPEVPAAPASHNTRENRPDSKCMVDKHQTA